MKHLRIIALGTAAFGFSFVGTWPVAAITAETMAPETEESEESPRAGPGFSAEQLRRLSELRAWLARRKIEREQNLPLIPEPRRARNITVYTDRQLLTPLGQRYAIGFQNGRSASSSTQGSPVLHIGRGPDGRIHHRYVFSDSEQNTPAPPSTYSTELRGNRTPPSQILPRGTGIIQSGQRIVRIWTPEPADQRTAPRLDYQLPDQRQ